MPRFQPAATFMLENTIRLLISLLASCYTKRRSTDERQSLRNRGFSRRAFVLVECFLPLVDLLSSADRLRPSGSAGWHRFVVDHLSCGCRNKGLPMVAFRATPIGNAVRTFAFALS